MQEGEHADAEHAPREPAERQVEAERGARESERRVGDGTEDQYLEPDGGALREHRVTPAHRVRENQLQAARVLLPGERPCAGANREHDREQRQHEAEDSASTNPAPWEMSTPPVIPKRDLKASG